MKVAFLVTAHAVPEQLSLLIKKLNANWNNIYVHVDASSDIEQFRAAIDAGCKPVFIQDEQRVSVNWGGYSLVRATLTLLSTALESATHYDRFCLLSGSDYPIKDIEEIRTAFSTDKEYMRVDRLLDGSKPDSYTKSVSHFHFYDFQDQTDFPASGTIRRELYHDIPLYHGASWWALSYDCIGFIIDYLQNHPDYLEFHKYTFCPEEVLFHSIVKSSPFAGNITHDFEIEHDLQQYFLLNEHGCHYIDWNTRGVRLPKVLAVEDACKLFHSSALFARKFDTEKSRSLLQILNQSMSTFENGGVSHSRFNDSIQGIGKGDVEKVWVVGDGRSGTTWLSELINSNKEYFSVFEPIHPMRSKEMEGVGLFPFRTPDQKDWQLEKFCKNIFTGKVFTPGSILPEKTLVYPDRVLVKDIFSHLIVRWVMNRVEGLKLIILLRHPFAVALSKEKMGASNWKNDPVSFLSDSRLYEDYLSPHDGIVRQAFSYFEKQVTIWSIIHSVLFQQMEENEYLLMYYEKLCSQPEEELARIGNYLHMNDDFVENGIKQIDKVSKYSSPEVFKKRGRENYGVWRDRLTADEIKSGCRILREFKLDCIYNESIEPLSNGVSQFRRKLKING